MIVIHALGKKQRNGSPNAKTYPYWGKLISLLEKEYEKIIQVGIKGEKILVRDFRANLSIRELEDLLRGCKFWVAIDSFLPHLAHHVGKPGVILWGQSDPNIYGYAENLNLLKDRKYLRKDQFGVWEGHPYEEDAFVKADDVFALIGEWQQKQEHENVL